MSATKIAVVNQKGGTGKTTTAVNLGCALQQLGKEVLLIDFDPQASLTYYLGLADCELSLAEVIFGDVETEDILLKAEGVSVLPAKISLADAEISLVNYKDRESVLEKIVAPIEHLYDFIIVDCPPTFSFLTVNALNFANNAIIPLQLEVLSMQALNLIINTIFNVKEALNPRLSIMGILPVMVDYRRNVTSEILEHIKGHFGLPIFNVEIGVDVKAVEAPSFAQSIIQYAPDAKSALAYKALAKIIAKT